MRSFFVTKASFYGVQVLATYPTPKLEDHPLSAVRGCLLDALCILLFVVCIVVVVLCMVLSSYVYLLYYVLLFLL